MKHSKIYKAEYADENMEIFCCPGGDAEALCEARNHTWEHGILFNLYELDENYEVIRTIY